MGTFSEILTPRDIKNETPQPPATLHARKNHVPILGNLHPFGRRHNNHINGAPHRQSINKMKRIYTQPHDSAYIGSTEGPDWMSEETADRLNDATAPAYIQDEDGHRHFFDLCPV